MSTERSARVVAAFASVRFLPPAFIAARLQRQPVRRDTVVRVDYHVDADRQEFLGIEDKAEKADKVALEGGLPALPALSSVPVRFTGPFLTESAPSAPPVARRSIRGAP